MYCVWRLLAVLTVCMSSSVVFGVDDENSSGIYKTTDAFGRTIFTDNPNASEKAEGVDLKKTNIQSGKVHNTGYKRDRPKAQNKTTLSIRNPQDGVQIGPAIKTLSIQASVSRSIRRKEGLIFYMNGVPLNGKPTSSTLFSLPLSLKDRGKKSISASLINKSTGDVIAVAPSITVYILRP